MLFSSRPDGIPPCGYPVVVSIIEGVFVLYSFYIASINHN